jgi:hypothetical protein
MANCKECTVSSDERKTENETKAEDSASELKSGQKARRKLPDSTKATAWGKETMTGLSRLLQKPPSESTEDALTRKAEDIQSQYNQFKKAKELSVSGVSSECGDLLKGLPEDSKEESSGRVQGSSSAEGSGDKAGSEKESP